MAPIFAYLLNKTLKSGNIDKPFKRVQKIKIKDFSLIDDIILLKERKEYYGIYIIELDNNIFKIKDSETEFYQKMVKLGKILTNIDMETEFRLIKHDIPPDKIATKIKDELDKLSNLKRSDILVKNLEEREKELRRMYELILDGEKIVWASAFIILRKKLNRKDQVELFRHEVEEVKKAIEYTLGVKAKKLSKVNISNLLETKFLLAPVPDKPGLVSEKNVFTITPSLLIDNEIPLEKGVFIGYFNDSKRPFLLDVGKYGKYHTLIVGPTGRGKTTLMALLVRRIYARGLLDFCIIDPKGDTVALLPSSLNIYRVSRSTEINYENVQEYLNIINSKTNNPSRYMGKLSELHNNLEKKDTVALDYVTLERLETSIFGRLIYVDIGEKNVKRLDKDFFNRRETALLMDNLTDEGRELVSFLLLKTLQDYMYSSGISAETRKILFIDEAWRFSDASIYYTNRLIKEARGFGISLFLSTQSLQDIPEEILHNFGNYIIFGSSDTGYIKSVSNVTGISEEFLLNKLPELGVGKAIFKLAERRPVIVEIAL